MDAGRAWSCPVTGKIIPMEHGFEMKDGMYLTDIATIKLLAKLNDEGNSKSISWMVETGISAGRVLPLKLFNLEESSDEES